MLRTRFKFMLTLVLLVTLVVAVSYIVWVPTTTVLSIYNSGWSGLSEFASDVKPVILLDLVKATNLDPHNTVLVVPLMRELQQDEIRAILVYVMAGGHVVILDDTGYSRRMMEVMGINVSIKEDTIILDEAYRLGSRYHPLARLMDELNYTVVLDAPRPILWFGEGVKPVLQTSPFSYLDIDRNGYYTPGEERGPFIVAVSIRWGEGKLILISDTGILMNELYGHNRRFIATLLDRREVYLDQSTVFENIHDYLKYVLRETQVSSSLALVLLLIAGAVGAYAARTS